MAFRPAGGYDIPGRLPITLSDSLLGGMSLDGGVSMSPLSHLLIASAIFVPAPMARQDGLTGQLVMPKQSGTPFRIADPAPKEAGAGSLHMIEYRVVKDAGEELLLVEDGKEVLVQKEAMVPQSEAIAFFTELIEKEPNNAMAYAFRGWAWKQKTSIDNALKDYAKAIELAPNQCAWRNNRALIWIELKEFDKAISDYDESLRLFPQYALGYRNRGHCWLKKKDYGNALKDFEKSVELGPQVPVPHNSLAHLLSTCPEAKIRNGDKALEEANKANELSGWRNGAYLDTLASAYAELGKFDEAVKYQEKAFADPYFAKEKDKADKARKRLQLYRDKKPYREEPE
jgi:tetratricopeptide (TPR) repeat protein